jgi:hypothetical protein
MLQHVLLASLLQTSDPIRKSRGREPRFTNTASAPRAAIAQKYKHTHKCKFRVAWRIPALSVDRMQRARDCTSLLLMPAFAHGPRGRRIAIVTRTESQQQQCVDAAIPVQMHSITLGRGDLAPL